MELDELTPEVRKRLGLTKERKVTFNKESVRSHALKVLAQISDLSQDQRRCVLAYAKKVNEA